MTLDMTNPSFAEGWFIQALRIVKSDLEFADQTKDAKARTDRLANALYVAQEGLAKYDAAIAEKERANQVRLEDARRRKVEAEARILARRTPLPIVSPQDGGNHMIGRDGTRIPLFLQK